MIFGCFYFKKITIDMKDFGIFYGSTTGTTAEIAHELGKLLGVADEDIHDVKSTTPLAMGNYKTIVLGSSTWGDGDLQEDIYDFLDGAGALDLSGHRIALFGTGDETMSSTFCNAIGKMKDALLGTRAMFVGDFPATEYKFEHSVEEHDGILPGLAVDQVNHPNWTPGRLKEWVEKIKKV